jgi:ABC-2 type transport system permease protein
VLTGYVQTIIFLIAARLLFDVPFEGSAYAFFLGFNLFIIVNLALGFLVSTVARNQLQAMQMSFFTILPSILLSGFMFPFAAMPGWAQAIGSIVPATHFLRIVRKIMLKGADLGDISGDMTNLIIIMVAIVTVAMLRYRQTLD